MIVGTRATKKICDLFGFSKFERAEREEIVALEYLYMFLGKDAGMIKVMQMWDWTFHLNRDRIRFCEEFTFMDTFRSYIFHFDDKETPEFPCFNNNQDMIRKEFEVKGLEKGNTVILAPFAYSLEHPPKEFWRCLTGYLSEMGKKVVVNIDPASIHGKEENYISGIPEISFDLREGVPCLEYAGIFIGMRSGLCDIISSAKCKKIILYPQVSGIDYDRHRPDKAFSSLEAMGLCDEVTELELDMEGNTEYWNEQARQIVLKIKQEKK